MAWERGRYYTRSRKVNGRVVREYFGIGLFGELAAREDHCERERRFLAREKWRNEKLEMESIDSSIDRLFQIADIIEKAAIVSSGFHYHRGQWRMRRGSKD